MALPRGWLEAVNRPPSEAELEALRRSIARGTPFGSEASVKAAAKRLGVQSTLRPPRPSMAKHQSIKKRFLTPFRPPLRLNSHATNDPRRGNRAIAAFNDIGYGLRKVNVAG